MVVSWDFYVTLTSLFLLGVSAGGDISTPPSVVIESIPPSYRKRVILMNMGYCAGPLISQLIALMIKLWWAYPIEKWRVLTAIILLITIILAIIRDDMLESPIYLYKKNGDTEFVSVIIKMAKSNNRYSYEIKAPLLVSENPQSELESSDSKSSIKEIFRSEYLYTTLMLSLTQALYYFSFMGILLFLPTFLAHESGDWSYIILIAEQVAGIAGLFVTSKLIDTAFGRKWTMSLGFIVCGVMVFPFVLSKNIYFTLGTACLFYFGLLMGIAAKNLITPESYTSDIRGKGVGFVTAISRITGIISPIYAGYVTKLFGSEVTCASFGVAFLLAGVISMFLKETRKVKFTVNRKLTL